MQDAAAVPGVTDVVVPSPSGLNLMRFEELVDHYHALALFLGEKLVHVRCFRDKWLVLTRRSLRAIG